VFGFSHFLHVSKTVVIIIIGFRCLGSSCLDLGLASAPDCLASVSTSLPLSRSHLGLICGCLASAFAWKILPRSLPLPRKKCLDYNPGHLPAAYLIREADRTHPGLTLRDPSERSGSCAWISSRVSLSRGVLDSTLDTTTASDLGLGFSSSASSRLFDDGSGCSRRRGVTSSCR